MHVHLWVLPYWRRGREEVRITKRTNDQIINTVLPLLDMPDLSAMLNGIKGLRERLDGSEVAGRPRSPDVRTRSG